MLQHIYIKNYAIIDELNLDLSKGLNILTGETGAGKSIIVDAIQLVIGGRASSDMIRYGESKAVIECTLNIEFYKDLISSIIELEEEPFGNSLIIRREINQKGFSRCFVNDSPTTVAKLKELGAVLVDFHGQHEHQSLLNPQNHLGVVDSFAETDMILSEYKTIYYQLKKLISDYQDMLKNKKLLLAKYDIIKYQTEEINKVKPKPNEDKEIEAELKKLENAEFLVSLSGELHSLMNGSDQSCYTGFSKAHKLIEQLTEFEPGFNEFSDEVASMIISVKEISSFSKDFLDSVEFSPSKIESLRSRISELKRLMKKYGSIEDILELLDRNISEIALIDKFDDRSELIMQDIASKSRELGSIAVRLSQLRKEKSELLSAEIVSKLRELGIENANFGVNFETEIISNENDIYSQTTAIDSSNYYRANATGIDKAEFLISANKGAVPKPLSETASGGEISRVMLAIKSILAGKDKVPVMVFDEIDTGISGRIAQKVGFNMKNLARSRQIIAITHLPQIAALGDLNIAVSKAESNGKTVARAVILDSKEKTYEIAKLISGETVTDATLQSAVQLINSEVINE